MVWSGIGRCPETAAGRGAGSDAVVLRWAAHGHDCHCRSNHWRSLSTDAGRVHASNSGWIAAGSGTRDSYRAGEDVSGRFPCDPRKLSDYYSLIRLLGAMPNILRHVRLRCAESANPHACAASVQEMPLIAALTADLTRTQSR